MDEFAYCSSETACGYGMEPLATCGVKHGDQATLHGMALPVAQHARGHVCHSATAEIIARQQPAGRAPSILTRVQLFHDLDG